MTKAVSKVGIEQAIKDAIPQTATKVVLYVTHANRLLVFLEPGFPHIRLQVPGGTVEPGEDVATAAARELAEETGIGGIASISLLGTRNYAFTMKDKPYNHTRHHFHITLTHAPQPRWSHWETQSSLRLGPIEFDLFWMDLDQAQRELGFGFALMLPELKALLRETPMS
jgi:8-oxo-dGTP pyrophosphatase MutT (NUDIX family)